MAAASPLATAAAHGPSKDQSCPSMVTGTLRSRAPASASRTAITFSRVSPSCRYGNRKNLSVRPRGASQAESVFRAEARSAR